MGGGDFLRKYTPLQKLYYIFKSYLFNINLIFISRADEKTKFTRNHF